MIRRARWRRARGAVCGVVLDAVLLGAGVAAVAGGAVVLWLSGAAEVEEGR